MVRSKSSEGSQSPQPHLEDGTAYRPPKPQQLESNGGSYLVRTHDYLRPEASSDEFEANRVPTGVLADGVLREHDDAHEGRRGKPRTVTSD